MPLLAPKSTQNQNRDDVWQFSILISILLFDGPKMAAKTVPRGPKSPQERPKTPLSGRFGSFGGRLGSFGGRLGVVFGCFGVRFVD